MGKIGKVAYLACVSCVLLMLSIQPSAEARNINLQVYPAELEPYEAVWIDLRLSECNNTRITVALYSPAAENVRLFNFPMPQGCAWRTSILIEYEWDYGTYIVVADITAPQNATSNITQRYQRTETFEVVFGPKVAARLYEEGIEEAVAPLVSFLTMVINQFVMAWATLTILGLLLVGIITHKYARRVRKLSWWDRTFGRYGLRADPIASVVGRHSFAPKLRARFQVSRYEKKVRYIDKLLEDLEAQTWALKEQRAYIEGQTHIGNDYIDGVSENLRASLQAQVKPESIPIPSTETPPESTVTPPESKAKAEEPDGMMIPIEKEVEKDEAE